MEPITGNVFAAECIRKTRTKKGKIEYLIKWKGWSSRYDTWEPADNILDNRLIQDFDKRQERLFQRKNSPKKAKSNKTVDKRKASAAQSKSSSSANATAVSRVSANTVAPLRIKISGLENEEDQTETSNDSESYASSLASSSAVSSPNAPPKLSPQGPLPTDSNAAPVNGLTPAGAGWENDASAGTSEKRNKVKRIDCTGEFSFTNRTLTDVRVNETTVTFVEL